MTCNLRLVFITILLLPLHSLAASSALPSLHWQLVERIDHQPLAFTQGLELYKDRLFESSGLYGQSRLLARRFPPDKNAENALRGAALPADLFAEGLTLYRGQLYLLTWRAGKGLIIDPEHFGLLGQFHYEGEGWGLCYHPALGSGGAFVMSDGTDRLQLRSPEDFSLRETLLVRDGETHYGALNELECHGDYVLANQWKEPRILLIRAATGEVRGQIDLSGLVKQERESWTATVPPVQARQEAVLNGIAYDRHSDTWLVGGKLWPHLYRIRIEFPDDTP